MKTLKLFLVLTLFAQGAMALNFNGVQSLAGLNTTRIFTAPASTSYFVQGYLNLPWGSNTGNTMNSRVIATVSKNYVTLLYTGLPGASGFALPSVRLASNDLITVNLASSVTSDTVTGNGISAVTGQVYFGNNF